MPTPFVVMAVSLVALPAAAQQEEGNPRELNGFLVGQYLSAVENSFDEVLESYETDSDWAYRVFLHDREHRAYMTFEFTPGEFRRTYSIQLAGDAGTEMLPFLGLRLGAFSSEIRMAVGEPSEVRYLEESDVQLWTYEGRNFSFQIAALRLSSIMIYASEPTDVMPPVFTIEEIAAGLASRDVDRIIELVASDVEITGNDELMFIDGAARTYLADTTNAFVQALYAGPNSLGALLENREVLSTAVREWRTYEDGLTGWVYTFGENTPLEEVVLEVDEGAWRIWEVRFRE